MGNRDDDDEEIGPTRDRRPPSRQQLPPPPPRQRPPPPLQLSRLSPQRAPPSPTPLQPQTQFGRRRYAPQPPAQELQFNGYFGDPIDTNPRRNFQNLEVR